MTNHRTILNKALINQFGQAVGQVRVENRHRYILPVLTREQNGKLIYTISLNYHELMNLGKIESGKINRKEVTRIKNYLSDRTDLTKIKKNLIIESWVTGNLYGTIQDPPKFQTRIDTDAVQVQNVFENFYILSFLKECRITILQGLPLFTALQELRDTELGIRLTNQSFMIDLFLDMSLYDAALNCYEVSRMNASIFKKDPRYEDPQTSQWACYLIEQVPFWQGKIQLKDTAVGSKSTKLYTLLAIKKTAKILELTGKSRGGKFGEKTVCAINYVLQRIPRIQEIQELEQVTSKIITEFKQDSILAHHIGLYILAQQIQRSFIPLNSNKSPSKQNEHDYDRLKKLAQNIDWSRKGELWQGNIIQEGKFVSDSATIEQANQRIEEHLNIKKETLK